MSQSTEAYAEDPTFTDEKHAKNWSFIDSLWWDCERIVVPSDKDIKNLILVEFHDSVHAGHLGLHKIIKNI